MPRFSVIIPCYNAAGTLPATLDSLRAQSFGDWECLLVDDGSADATPGIIAAACAADPRFRAVANPGKGPSRARNAGVAAASAEILAFCDADDQWMEAKLARLDRLFGDETVDAAFARVAFFSDAGAQSLSDPGQDDLDIAALLGENPVCTMSNIAVRSAAFLDSGGFDEEMVHAEDLEWLIRLVGTGHRVVPLAETLVRYRTNPQGLSADVARMRRGRFRALSTAEVFGYRPRASDEAVHFRYLARRALRVGLSGVGRRCIIAEAWRSRSTSSISRTSPSAWA
nr:glycosyltransferase family 2 protein [Mangrovicoccus ximenensis]